MSTDYFWQLATTNCLAHTVQGWKETEFCQFWCNQWRKQNILQPADKNHSSVKGGQLAVNWMTLIPNSRPHHYTSRKCFLAFSVLFLELRAQSIFPSWIKLSTFGPDIYYIYKPYLENCNRKNVCHQREYKSGTNRLRFHYWRHKAVYAWFDHFREGISIK